jgi:hypothetical protein
MLPCAPVTAMKRKWRGGDGEGQARFRLGEREASVGDEGGPEEPPTMDANASHTDSLNPLTEDDARLTITDLRS